MKKPNEILRFAPQVPTVFRSHQATVPHLSHDCGSHRGQSMSFSLLCFWIVCHRVSLNMILARLLRLFEKQAKEHVHDVTAAVGLDGAHVCPGGVLCGARPAHMVQSEQGEAPALT